MTASVQTLKGLACIKYYEKVSQKSPRPRLLGTTALNVLDNYYSGEPGIWQSRGDAIVTNGATIQPGEIGNLMRGHSIDGTPLQAANAARTVLGVDLTYGVPADVSAMWANAPDKSPEKTAIENAVKDAAQNTNRHLIESGIIVTRRGKGGKIIEPVADCAVASIIQYLNRNDEPHIHVHNVWLSKCLRLDGQYGSLDIRPILAHKTQAGAIFRAELASSLKAQGFGIERDGRSFKVLSGDIGLKLELKTRRQQILDKKKAIRSGGEKIGAAIETALNEEETALLQPDRPGADRRLGDFANTLTKAPKKKADLSDADRQENWSQIFARYGYGPGDYVRALKRAAQGSAVIAVPPRPGDAAVAEALEMDSVVSARNLFRLIAEHAQVGGGGLSTIKNEWARLWSERKVEAIGAADSGDLMLSTSNRIATERAMLLDAVERIGENVGFGRLAGERAIARLSGLTDEQAAAIRWIARGDGVVVVEGVAGAGKSYTLGGVVDAAHGADSRLEAFDAILTAADSQRLPVIALAPARKAAEVVAAETGLRNARAIQGYVAELERGDTQIPRGALVIVDEAGMVGVSDMAPLLRHARAAGAQVLLTGDRLQLEAVQGGSPLAAIAELTGVARIERVRRQKVPWMRDASQMMAGGATGDGLRAYDAHDRITWSDHEAAALSAIGQDYAASIQKNRDAAHMIIASDNSTVHALNHIARRAYIDSDLISGPSITVSTHHRTRASQTEIRPMQIAIGERLLFGERLDELDINNGNFATVRGIAHDRRGAILTLAFDKSQKAGEPERTITVPFHRLARQGKRSDGIPRIQAAYAITTHKSQGQTIDRVFTYGAAGLDSRRSYVAMTRHRHDARLYVNCEAVQAQLRERGIQPTDTLVREAFFRNSQRLDTKPIVSQFVPDVRAWLRTGDLTAMDPVPSTARSRAQVRFNAARQHHLQETARADATNTTRPPRLLTVWNKQLLDRLEDLRAPILRPEAPAVLTDGRRQILVRQSADAHALHTGHHRHQAGIHQRTDAVAAYQSEAAQHFVKALLAEHLRAASSPFRPILVPTPELTRVRPDAPKPTHPAVVDDRRGRDDSRDQYDETAGVGGAFALGRAGSTRRTDDSFAGNAADRIGPARGRGPADGRDRGPVVADPNRLRRILALARLRSAITQGALTPAMQVTAPPPLAAIPNFDGAILPTAQLDLLLDSQWTRLNGNGVTLWTARGHDAATWPRARYQLSLGAPNDSITVLARDAEAVGRARGAVKIALINGRLQPDTPFQAVDPADRPKFDLAYRAATHIADHARRGTAADTLTPRQSAPTPPRPAASITVTPPPIVLAPAIAPAALAAWGLDGRQVSVSDYLTSLIAAEAASRLAGDQYANARFATAVTRISGLTEFGVLSGSGQIAAASPLARTAYNTAIYEASNRERWRTEQEADVQPVHTQAR